MTREKEDDSYDYLKYLGEEDSYDYLESLGEEDQQQQSFELLHLPQEDACSLVSVQITCYEVRNAFLPLFLLN